MRQAGPPAATYRATGAAVGLFAARVTSGPFCNTSDGPRQNPTRRTGSQKPHPASLLSELSPGSGGSHSRALTDQSSPAVLNKRPARNTRPRLAAQTHQSLIRPKNGTSMAHGELYSPKASSRDLLSPGTIQSTLHAGEGPFPVAPKGRPANVFTGRYFRYCFKRPISERRSSDGLLVELFRPSL